MSTADWYPTNFDEGIQSITEAIACCHRELSDSVCALIAKFVIGDKWPYTVLIKREAVNPGKGAYETFEIFPCDQAQVLYNKCRAQMHYFDDMVLINRETFRKLARDRTFFEQNVMNGAKFECSRNFQGRGRLYHVW